MHIKKFDDFIVEKYDNVTIDGGGGDRDLAIKDDHDRLDIINKYFPFNNVSGRTAWEEGIVDLSFDDGKITIKGKYVPNEDIMPSTFSIDDESYKFNWHPFDGMGSINMEKFESEIKSIYEDTHGFSLCLSHEGYSLFNIGDDFKSEEEALNKLKEYEITLVKGKQMEGKLLKKNYKRIS